MICTASTYSGIETRNHQISEAKVISPTYSTASRTVIRFVFVFARSEHLRPAGSMLYEIATMQKKPPIYLHPSSKGLHNNKHQRQIWELFYEN